MSTQGVLARARKTVDNDAVEHLKSIPSIQSLLKGKKAPVTTVSESSAGFMLLSRFNKDESEVVKVRESRHKANDFEEHSILEAKSIESSNSAVSNLEKNRRYALSLATLATKPHKRLQIVADGAIAILVELASHHDKLTQVRCASAFASLSVERTIRARMLDEGTLAILISLATNSNIREIKSDCCKAICNLCCVSGYEFKMVKEGVPFTVLNIAAACPETLDICLMTLRNISCIPDKFARIEDVTEALLYFSSHNILTLDQEILMLSALCNLSALRNNQLRLVEDGCLRIVEKYHKSKYTTLRKMVSEMLKNFTAESRSRSKLLDIDIISVIVSMSKDEEQEIRVLAAKCLLFLSKDRNFRRRIVNTSAFGLILETSRGSVLDTELGQIASKTLRVLCSDKDLAEKLVEEGVGFAIVSLMEVQDNVILQYCTESLCALFQLKSILPQLIDEGAHQMIVRLASQTMDPSTQEWCSFALYQLTESKECNFHFIENKMLPCILLLCDRGTMLAKLYCSAALAHATLDKKIDSSNAIPLLVRLLDSSESGTNVKKFCALSLFNMANDSQNCQKMLQEGALSPVVKLTQSTETKVICAGIISRLSLHQEYYDQFASGDVLKVLLELSCIDDRLAQRRVVIALSNLSHSETLCAKLLQLSPIQYIVSLASERDEYLRRGCISIVCNMSYKTGSEKAIVQGGIVPTLMITSLITSDQVVSRVICVKALVNLMADRSLYASMVKDGVIWGLSKLAITEHEELQTLCAKALCRLSCSFARDLINSSVAKTAVMKLLKSKNLEIVRPCARIMTNLLLNTTEADEKFRTDVVESMHSMASNQCDEELNALCVVCLCLASQSEASRITIVDSGMLNRIDPGAIFSSDHRISYAYISMFNNIANNPKMRTKVLDDHMIERFEKILEGKESALTLAVVQSLYYISCSSENIPKLVDQQIIPFIHVIIDSEGQISPVMMQYLVACLYNLSTVTEMQNALVCAGIVEVIVQLWNDACKEQRNARLLLLAVCHLACGKTNSSRIVADGCTPILCFITEHRKMSAFAQYTFSYDYHLRCSAALRNLLTVVANQRQMVEEGCLPVLIQMAKQSYDRLAGAASSNVLNTFTPSETKLIRINCAAALKLLTYNKDLRSLLVECEAIDIILAEIRKESDLNLSQGLLKELEAESWENGARTKQKEGRAKTLPPAPLFTEYLKGNNKVELDFEVKDVELEKYYVQVHSDEEEAMPPTSPNLRSNSMTSLPTSSGTSPPGTPEAKNRRNTLRATSSFRRSKLAKMVSEASLTAGGFLEPLPPEGIEQLKIEDLKPREDADDQLALMPMTYPKVECDVQVDAYALVRVDTAEELITEEDDTNNTNFNNTNSSNYSNNSNNNHQGDGGSGVNTGNQLVENSSETSIDMNKGKNFLHMLSNSLGTGKHGDIPSIVHITNHQSLKKSGSRQKSTMSRSGGFPNIRRGSSTQDVNDADDRKKKTQYHRPNDEMTNLILLINKAKHLKEEAVEEVLDKWKAISRF